MLVIESPAPISSIFVLAKSSLFDMMYADIIRDDSHVKRRESSSLNVSMIPNCKLVPSLLSRQKTFVLIIFMIHVQSSVLIQVGK
jgi:hypothetical protein